jgi:hypothetical protein
MEVVTKGLPNLLVHLDEIIVHSRLHPEHLDHLSRLFQRLRGHHLKINLPKSNLRLSKLSVLRFCFTPEGILPSEDHLKALKQTAPAASMQDIQQFLDMCNFLQNHIRNYAQTAAALNILTWKDHP